MRADSIGSGLPELARSASETDQGNFTMLCAGTTNLARPALKVSQADFPNPARPAPEVGQANFPSEVSNRPIFNSSNVEADLDDWRAL